MSAMTDRTALKSLLKVGTTLLQPPAPLPSAPAQILERLRQSSLLVPEWRDRAGWREEDELEEIGDDDETDAARRKERRDALVLAVGLRCLDILVAMQGVLEREFWPVEQRGIMEPKDFLLGTADLRLMRLMLAHVVSSALLTFVSAYVSGLPSRAPVDPRLLTMLSTLIQLVASPQPPAGGSNASAPLPPTAITQTIITAHLTPLLIAAVMAGWTPTAPPATFASIRASLLTALAGLPATQALASLGTSLKLLQSGRKSKPRGWVRSWPPYADGALGTLMSGQMQRPGGVKAVMENVFGEAANLLGPEGVDGSKLDQIAGVLSRVPRNVAPEVYIPQLLTTLFDLIAPESATHPLVYTHTAAYVVHHLWNSSPIAVNWLRERLHVPLLPANLSVGVVATPEGVQSLLTALSQLVTHAPPSPQFVDFLIAPILPPLFALHVALLTPSKAGIIEKRPEATGLAASVHMVLLAWGKVVPQAEGVKGVWTVVQGGKGWPEGEGGREIFWRRTGDGAELVYDYPDQPMDVDIATHMEDEEDMLGQLDLAPDSSAFAVLLKEFERPDIASDVFLKVLDEWRVRVNADEADPFPALLFLRLTLAMMDTMRERLLTNPEHVLSFVEGVLSDEAATLTVKKPEPEIKENKPLIEMIETEPTAPTGPLIEEMDVDEELPELTEEGVQKMGMVDTAISLLLASLEANEKLDHASAAILHPISDHLEQLSRSHSSAVRGLAREASLVLLLRRSASLTSEEGKVSPVVATYRRALKLVADEILPVRAHGLVLLRDLVLSKDYESALTPSILDVYMKSILDKDSYIYLNAVKGLAAMADALSQDIFRTLVREYRVTNADLAGDALDRTLRIGEALGMVIRRAGKMFSTHANLIVPSLLAMFPNTTLPTVLRTSALSLLSTCAEVDHLALLPWADELTSAAIDLVQVETVTSAKEQPKTEAEAKPEVKPKPKVVLIDDEEEAPEEAEAQAPAPPRIIDEEPTTQDSKHPALRRAAIVFLGLLLASVIEAANNARDANKSSEEFQMRLPGSIAPRTTAGPASTSGPAFGLPSATLERAATVLSYVAMTDVDEVVRGQAGEVVALVERLRMLRAGPQML